jgi:hypothetical protein
MAMNPLTEKGIPLEKQLRPWSELNVKPYDKNMVDPYTRSRIILMNGIEVEGAIFSHNFQRNLEDVELKKKLAFTRRIEQFQQKVINWLSPGDESVLETTIGYEQVAVDLTAYMAKNLKDPYLKQVFDFGLLEDFDHLYRYANLLEMTQGIKAEKLLKDYTEVTPGRPTANEHRHPYDDVRKFSDRKAADPFDKLCCLTLTAGEQQTMNFYMNVGPTIREMVGRGLYLEIGMIEEQHVTQYGSLLDPRMSWLENALMHEYNECWLYWAFMEQETDRMIKPIWELHLNMELAHLQMMAETCRQMGMNVEEMLPKEFPKPILFESQVEYVRGILGTQVEFNAVGTEIGPPSKLPENPRYPAYQKAVNDTQSNPSIQVIEQNIKKNGKDYRYELAGEHPVKGLRSRETVVTH